MRRVLSSCFSLDEGGSDALPAHRYRPDSALPIALRSLQDGVSLAADMRHLVKLRFAFMKLGDIDTIKETFEASIFFEAKWREKKLDDEFEKFKKDGDVDSNHDHLYVLPVSRGKDCGSDLPSYWNPHITVDNAVDGSTDKQSADKRSHYVEFNNRGEAFIVERARIKGKFYERMELDHFPFDTQDITVTLISGSSTKEVILLADTSRSGHSFQEFIFTDAQEWEVVPMVEAQPGDQYSECRLGPRYRAALSFTTHVSRRSTFYIINIWVISFVLCGLAMCIFGLERKNLQGRLQLSFILILTTVTFKFFVAGTIPKISYLTLLDKTVLLNFFFLVILAVWHTVQAQYTTYDPNHILHQHEKWAVLVFGVGYLLTMSILFISVYIKARNRRLGIISKANRIDPIDFVPDSHLTNGPPVTVHSAPLTNSDGVPNRGFLREHRVK